MTLINRLVAITMIVSLAACAGAAENSDDSQGMDQADSANHAQSDAGMTVQDDYVEAVVVVSDDAAKKIAAAWFKENGFNTLPMRVGFLITATAGSFEKAFGVSIKERAAKRELPIPPSLEGHVEQVQLHQVPDYSGQSEKE